MKIEIGCGGGKAYEFNPKICPECNIMSDIKIPDFWDDPVLRLPYFIRLDAQHLPFRNEVFDEVYMSHIAEHLSNPMKSLKDVHRILKKGGTVHIWVPNFMDKNSRDPTHIHIFNILSLRRLLKKCGFKFYFKGALIGSYIPKLFRKLTALFFLSICYELYVVGEKV